MRIFILALMITLLPLRSWAGNVMATEMAAQVPQKAGVNALVPTNKQANFATKSIASYAHYDWAAGTFELKNTFWHASAMSPDCLEHISSAGDESADAGCGDCAACQMCHTVALTTAVRVAPPALQAGLTAPSVVLPFASAEAALGQKPPIS